ncbi:FAD-dependent oxidoreductase [Halanaerobiaceae bacterium Z-7014]|uniref:FAD-dependent oxidoreductase n=1 Tax=Halonatronomonas betaini TaxID=2778430 RepID=A0A931F684_9FIRM|nr:FAD-dependent oxidoreductase [Halonatronomonas betaini]MBF8436645.1 FAD-dependent oxidoreductase [Halonatronomonas betaini]
MKTKRELVVVGGGPAGLAAALEAHKKGVKDILLIERDEYLGGILQQCIHNGFGLDYFNEELTGPEYAERFIDELKDKNIDVQLKTMVIDINEEKLITALSSKDGIEFIEAESIILAMGCRERTREAIRIPGTRPAGVMTAGAAQRYINIEGYLPGREIVILGSGDIGLIMARRLALEGADVKGVFEIMPYSSGLVRNKVQCLDDFGIPLYLQQTVAKIYGQKRVEAVDIVEVDDNLNQITETKKTIQCDTLLLSVGLIPENELSQQANISLDDITGGPIVDQTRETDIPGVFACGNVLQVHDLVDNVSEESEIAGKAAAEYLLNDQEKEIEQALEVSAGENITYVVPHTLNLNSKTDPIIELFFRVKDPAEDCKISIKDNKEELASYTRPIVEPGEIESVKLPVKLINKDSNEIIVELITGGE